MKYLSLLFLTLATISVANTETQVNKPQNVSEFCAQNPHHEKCKLIKQIFDQVKPRSKLSRMWRLITGKDIFLPNDFLRHYLLSSCEDIGKELKWEKAKVYEEFEKLYAEVQRIRSSK